MSEFNDELVRINREQKEIITNFNLIKMKQKEELKELQKKVAELEKDNKVNAQWIRDSYLEIDKLQVQNAKLLAELEKCKQ